MRYEITLDAVAAYLADGDDAGQGLVLAGGTVAAPPTITARDYSRLLATRYRIDMNAYAAVAQTYLVPVVAPLMVEVEGTVLSTYLKRGREYLVLETVTRDASGKTLALSRHTIWMNSGVRHPYEEEPRAPREARTAEPAGRPLDPIEKIATLRPPPGGYAWGSPHHEDYARRALGLRGALVLGNTTMSYAGELARRHFGTAWLTGGTLDIAFTGGVVAGDRITAGGTARETAGDLAIIDIRIENHATGVPAVVGTATCPRDP